MSISHRLLLIDDDPVLRQILSDHLGAAGFTTKAGGIADAGATDAAIVDGGLGAEAVDALCRQLKAASPHFPVIVLAAQPLAANADAVVAKPLRMGNLVSKLRELLERKEAARPVRIGGWRFDGAARALEAADGHRVRLTDKETAILRCLEKAGGVVARERLLAEVWGYSGAVSTHTLETHIYRLRRKLEPDPDRATLLVTEPGGYRLAI